MWTAPINTAPECGIPHPLSPSRMTLRNTLPRADMTTGHGARLALPTTARRYGTCLVRGCCVRRSQHGLVAARGDRPAKILRMSKRRGGHLGWRGHAKKSRAGGPFLPESWSTGSRASCYFQVRTPSSGPAAASRILEVGADTVSRAVSHEIIGRTRCASGK